jgi:hypothetical protein
MRFLALNRHCPNARIESDIRSKADVRRRQEGNSQASPYEKKPRQPQRLRGFLDRRASGTSAEADRSLRRWQTAKSFQHGDGIISPRRQIATARIRPCADMSRLICHPRRDLDGMFPAMAGDVARMATKGLWCARRDSNSRPSESKSDALSS